MVWLLWSMKEAAYKCYTQQHKKRFFAPQKFECHLISKDKGIVVFEHRSQLLDVWIVCKYGQFFYC